MIPYNAKHGIDQYVNNGIPTGDFLYAVLTNNLFEAAGRADEGNRYNLAAICEYIYNYIPAPCWGTKEKVAEWLKLHRENPEQAELIASADRKRRENYE